MLRAPFQPAEAFAPSPAYRLLPFRFDRLRGEEYLLTNLVGEYVILPRRELDALVARRLAPETPSYRKLKARHFLFDDASLVALDLLTLKARSRAERIAEFTGLHIFVVTLRCDHSCQYCQVSRQSVDPGAQHDMSAELSRGRCRGPRVSQPQPDDQDRVPGRRTPSELRADSTHRAPRLYADHQRDGEARILKFIIASTLHHLSDGVLAFCKDERIDLSDVDRDGPADLHDAHRRSPGGNSHASDPSKGSWSRSDPCSATIALPR